MFNLAINNITDFEWFYTFTYKNTDNGEIYDNTLVTAQFEGGYGPEAHRAVGNVMKEYLARVSIDDTDAVFMHSLNNITLELDSNIAQTTGFSSRNNTWGKGCHDMAGFVAMSNHWETDGRIFVWGDYFINNTFGNSCYSNTFGNSCFRNSLLEGATYARWNMFDTGVQYVLLTSSTAGSSSNQLQNVHICQGVCGTGSGANRKTITATRNNANQVEYKTAGSEVITV